MTTKKNTGISLTPPEPITPDNLKDHMITDDELKEKLLSGELEDPRLEATLFPNGRPAK